MNDTRNSLILNNSASNVVFSSIYIWLCAGLIVFLKYLLQSPIDFDLGDEGFLWYGAQGVISGEVPMRDFMAYAPFRYYWSAFIMKIMSSTGLYPLRFAAYLLEFLGVGLSLSMINNSKTMSLKNLISLPVFGLCIAFWMYPYFKAYDYIPPILTIYFLRNYLNFSGVRSVFLIGILVGSFLYVGQNHLLYAIIAICITALYFPDPLRKMPWRGSKAFFSGVVVGALPLLLMLALIDGFFLAFYESIRIILEAGQTNLSKPVPWPWRVDFSGFALGFPSDLIRDVLVGALFLFIPIWCLLNVVYIFKCRPVEYKYPNATIASVFVTIPYLHYAYSRADVLHLVLAVVPMLVGLLCLIDVRRWTFLYVFCICAITYAIMRWYQPYTRMLYNGGYSLEQFRNEKIMVHPSDRIFLKALVASISNPNYKSSSRVLVLPLYPGIYPLLGQRAPIWEVYPLFPRSKHFQYREIERLKENPVDLILIDDIKIDGREELRYKNSHSILYNQIFADYIFESNRDGSNREVFRSKN